MSDPVTDINPNAGTLVRDKLWFDDGFAMVPNPWVRDAKLSFAARGLLAYLVSHSAGFELSVDFLMRHAPEGRDSIRQLLGEIERAGYLRRYRGRDRGKFGRIKWHLRDPHMPENIHGEVTLDLEPIDPYAKRNRRSGPAPENPSPVAPSPEQPAPVNPRTIEDHPVEDSSRTSKRNPGTRAGDEEDGFAEVRQAVAEWRAEDYERLIHQPCPYRKNGGEHTFSGPGSACSWCGIAVTHRWHRGDVLPLDELRAQLEVPA